MLSEDPVRFSSTIEIIDGEYRASYIVSLADGHHRSGVRRFAERQEARAWIEEEARLYGTEFVCEE